MSGIRRTRSQPKALAEAGRSARRGWPAGRIWRGEGGEGGCGEDVAPRAAGRAEEPREEERGAGEEGDQRHASAPGGAGRRPGGAEAAGAAGAFRELAASAQAMRATGASTSCAMRMPWAMVTGSAPWLIRMTPTSPR